MPHGAGRASRAVGAKINNSSAQVAVARPAVSHDPNMLTVNARNIDAAPSIGHKGAAAALPAQLPVQHPTTTIIHNHPIGYGGGYYGPGGWFSGYFDGYIIGSILSSPHHYHYYNPAYAAQNSLVLVEANADPYLNGTSNAGLGVVEAGKEHYFYQFYNDGLLFRQYTHGLQMGELYVLDNETNTWDQMIDYHDWVTAGIGFYNTVRNASGTIELFEDDWKHGLQTAAKIAGLPWNVMTHIKLHFVSFNPVDHAMLVPPPGMLERAEDESSTHEASTWWPWGAEEKAEELKKTLEETDGKDYFPAS
jgi:hypothetical protein